MCMATWSTQNEAFRWWWAPEHEIKITKYKKIPVNYPLLVVGINTKTLCFIAGVMHGSLVN